MTVDLDVPASYEIQLRDVVAMLADEAEESGIAASEIETALFNGDPVISFSWTNFEGNAVSETLNTSDMSHGAELSLTEVYQDTVNLETASVNYYVKTSEPLAGDPDVEDFEVTNANVHWCSAPRPKQSGGSGHTRRGRSVSASKRGWVFG